MDNKIKVIKKFNKLSDSYDTTWIGSNAHIAFLVALGEGPWDDKKRHSVQKKAIEWFLDKNVSDFRNLELEYEEVYPLEWQNNFLFNMLYSLHEQGDLFEALCFHWKISNGWKNSLEDLFERCGATKKDAKSLWIFARDYLKLPSFPINKEIRKTLKLNELPDCPFKIIDLCQRANIDPNVLNRKMYFKGNLDWSKY